MLHLEVLCDIIDSEIELWMYAAEMQHLDVHRWFGQGGSGAPIKDAHGNILTDYNARRVR